MTKRPKALLFVHLGITIFFIASAAATFGALQWGIPHIEVFDQWVKRSWFGGSGHSTQSGYIAIFVLLAGAYTFGKLALWQWRLLRVSEGEDQPWASHTRTGVKFSAQGPGITQHEVNGGEGNGRRPD